MMKWILVQYASQLEAVYEGNNLLHYKGFANIPPTLSDDSIGDLYRVDSLAGGRLNMTAIRNINPLTAVNPTIKTANEIIDQGNWFVYAAEM